MKTKPKKKTAQARKKSANMAIKSLSKNLSTKVNVQTVMEEIGDSIKNTYASVNCEEYDTIFDGASIEAIWILTEKTILNGKVPKLNSRSFELLGGRKYKTQRDKLVARIAKKLLPILNRVAKLKKSAEVLSKNQLAPMPTGDVF